MDRFRLRAKKLFLTYPKCDVDVTTAKRELEKILPQFKTWCIAQENHKDGSLHLHAYIEFSDTQTFNNSTFADILSNHGNYQAARNRTNVLRYVCKNGKFESNLSDYEIQTITKISEDQAATLLINDDSITEVIERRPSLLFKINNIKASIDAFKERKLLKSEETEMVSELPNTLNLRLPVDTDVKQCHYWVWSKEPNRGKTTGLVEKVLELPNSVLFDFTSTYHSVKISTQIIVIDEMSKGQTKAQSLNKMCDGHASYRVFMKGEVQTKAKAIILVCSNFSIEEVFPIMYKPVKARFVEINID